jgi:hypothetical protein
MAEAGAVCPPHRWLVSSTHVDGQLLYHHTCLECGAQKDVPHTAVYRPRWPKANAAVEAKAARR